VQVQASADLGSFGDRTGPPVNHHVGLPNLMPSLLHWLMIAGLLVLIPNRCGQAWWIIAPLAGVMILRGTLGGPGWIPSEAMDLLGEVVVGTAFGLAAVWLLAPFLARAHRFLTFLATLSVLVVFSALAAILRQSMVRDESSIVIQGIVLLAIVALVLASALVLTGWVCRRDPRPVRLTLIFFGLLAGLWLVMVMPFFLVTVLAAGEGPSWLEFLAIPLVATVISFGVALPFLLLSFSNALFHERLCLLLHRKSPSAIAGSVQE
jgi:hypothetical protein